MENPAPPRDPRTVRRPCPVLTNDGFSVRCSSSFSWRRKLRTTRGTAAMTHPHGRRRMLWGLEQLCQQMRGDRTPERPGLPWPLAPHFLSPLPSSGTPRPNHLSYLHSPTSPPPPAAVQGDTKAKESDSTPLLPSSPPVRVSRRNWSSAFSLSALRDPTREAVLPGRGNEGLGLNHILPKPQIQVTVSAWMSRVNTPSPVS